MLRKLAVLVCALAAADASARCKTDGIFVFPAPGAVVPMNARFILEGAGSFKKKVSGLVGQTLVLRAKESSVPAITVQVKAGWESQRGRVAVVLLPTSQMQGGKEYSLLIDKQLGIYKILNDHAAETLTWKAAPIVDTTPPKFQIRPAVPEGQSERDKDGISSWVKLRAVFIEESPLYYVVRVSSIANPGAPKQLYPVPINGGEALLGHDACSGNFQFDSDMPYRFELETYDSAGNKSPDKISPIEAKSPIEPAE
jgi:hypothetical protein